jgi:hypothetical protein
MPIDFSKVEDVTYVLAQNKAVKLLRKEHAPLIIAFLWSTFKTEHRQTYRNRELTTRLSDFLFRVNDVEVHYPKEARLYLETWTQDGFLRQYYEEHEEEATFELTPATEQALLWISDLDKSEFVGAESRLLQVFNLLRELALGTTNDKEARLRQLRIRQAALEREIAAIENDEILRLDPTRIREQYFLVEETASKLLSDFRQIEENFRILNSKAREEQITRQGSRGEILDDIFSAQDAILETDQGKTFNAFWSFLMNQQRQDELDDLVKQLFALPELQGLQAKSLVPRLKMSLVEAGDRVNKTTDRLIEQLRRFLQSRSFLENKRMAEIITDIEQLALKVKNDPPPGRVFASLEGKALVNLVMDRAPFEPPAVLQLATTNLAQGSADDMVTAGLYEQHYVDPAELKARIQELLRGRDQISLLEISETIPFSKGLSELVAYFSIATAWENRQKAVIHPEKKEWIVYQKEGRNYRIEMPETLFLA